MSFVSFENEVENILQSFVKALFISKKKVGGGEKQIKRAC